MIKKNKKFLFIIFLFEISIMADQNKIAITPVNHTATMPSSYSRKTNNSYFIINYDATETVGSLKKKIIKEFQDKEVPINPDKIRLFTLTQYKKDYPTFPEFNFFDDENQAIIDIPKSGWIDKPPTIPSLFLYYD